MNPRSIITHCSHTPVTSQPPTRCCGEGLPIRLSCSQCGPVPGAAKGPLKDTTTNPFPTTHPSPRAEEREPPPRSAGLSPGPAAPLPLRARPPARRCPRQQRPSGAACALARSLPSSPHGDGGAPRRSLPGSLHRGSLCSSAGSGGAAR